MNADEAQDWISFFLDGHGRPAESVPDEVAAQWKSMEIAGDAAPCGITWRSFWEIARRYGAWQVVEEGH